VPGLLAPAVLVPGMKTTTRTRLTPDEIRNGTPGCPGLNTIGLTESPCWIDGFQFTWHTTPRAAVDSYLELKGVPPTHYCINDSNATFNLSHS
jgi:hypothetical protein